MLEPDWLIGQYKREAGIVNEAGILHLACRAEVEQKCSDPSYESDPSNEYSPLGLTHVMNSIFLDPSNEFLTQAVNIGIPKQTLGLCFHVSK